MESANIFETTNYLTSGLLIVSYITILVKVHRGTKYRFVQLLVWMLLFSNAANISYIYSVHPILNDPVPLPDYPWRTAAYIVSFVLKDISFNESHWIFS